MNPCCDSLADYIGKERSPIRIDDYRVTFLVSSMEGYTMERAISYCPFCGKDISIKNTHQLEDILSADSEFRIQFSDGTEIIAKDCDAIDFSIYNQTGGWNCRVVDIIGTEQQKKLFKPDSLMDFYEDDILSIRCNLEGAFLYKK